MRFAENVACMTKTRNIHISVREHEGNPHFGSLGADGRILLKLVSNTVAYSLKVRTVESQQPAVTRQRLVNNNREMIFPARSVPMAVHTIMDCIIPPISNNFTAKEEQCFLRGPYRDVKSRTVSEESVKLSQLVKLS
jgi:hypothetical protein